MTVAVLSAASLVALSALTPASAQAPRRHSRDTESITVIDQYGHRTTRITVRPRSFLDPGNNVEPYSQHYTDYAISPDSYAGEYLYDRTDWRSSWSRMPIPTCFDLPGMCR
ncbi:MAG TPA: hypothetical protein VGG01_10335 [Xanthobacteraceae bacterium]